jgi:hypothetical protein
MPFTGSGWTANFRSDLLQGKHNFNAGGDVFKVALYTNAANLDVSTTVAYTNQGEVVDATYIAGGNALSSLGIFIAGQGASFGLSNNGMVAWVSFSPLVWPGANFTCRGALLYNASKSSAAVSILDFGSDFVFANNNFTITFATGDPNQAPIQVH